MKNLILRFFKLVLFTFAAVIILALFVVLLSPPSGEGIDWRSFSDFLGVSLALLIPVFFLMEIAIASHSIRIRRSRLGSRKEARHDLNKMRSASLIPPGADIWRP